MGIEEAREERKKSPSWTIEEYDKHSAHTNLCGHLKVRLLRMTLSCSTASAEWTSEGAAAVAEAPLNTKTTGPFGP